MTENLNDNMTDIDDARQAQADPATVKPLPMIFHAQFVRDISFENPQPAHVYDNKGPRPVMDVSFSIECQPVESQQYKYMYEVQVGLKVQARREGQVIFVTELLYGVLVSLDGVPEDQHHPLLYIEAPRYAFPFVRQIVANLTQNAGMMPLLLSPVDFRALYMQRFAEEIRQSQTA